MYKNFVTLLLCVSIVSCGQKLNKYNASSIENDVVNMNNQNNIGNILPPSVDKVDVARSAGIIK